MTKVELLVHLIQLEKSYDIEAAHCEADEALLEFINDNEITEAYMKINRWYA